MTNSTYLICTPDQRLHVFVSSTLQELADGRQAARQAVERLRLTALLDRIHHDDRVSYKSFTIVQELRDLIENDPAMLLSESSETGAQSQRSCCRPPLRTRWQAIGKGSYLEHSNRTSPDWSRTSVFRVVCDSGHGAGLATVAADAEPALSPARIDRTVSADHRCAIGQLDKR